MKIEIKNGLSGPYVRLIDLCIFFDSCNSPDFQEQISYEYFKEIIFHDSDFFEGDPLEKVLEILAHSLENLVCSTCNGDSQLYDEDIEDFEDCERCDGKGYVNMSNLYNRISEQVENINLNPNIEVHL